METEENEKITYVRELANRLNFQCEIFYHEATGRTTEDAEKALGLKALIFYTNHRMSLYLFHIS